MKQKINIKKIIEESIQVFQVDVDQNGGWHPQSTPIDSSLYDLEFSYNLETGAESFDLEFKHSIDCTYLVTYSTKIALTSSSGKGTLTNSASFTGDGVKEEHSTSTSEVIVYVTEGSGTGSGVFGSIEIEKVDSENGTPLEGAEFTLYKNDIAIKKVKTDAEGLASFGYLLFGEYVLVETAAPEGYKLGESSYSVNINQSQQRYSFIVENDPIDTENGGSSENPGGGTVTPPEEGGDEGEVIPPEEGEDGSTAIPPEGDGDGGEEEPPSGDNDDGGSIVMPEESSTPSDSSSSSNNDKPGNSQNNQTDQSTNGNIDKLPQTGEAKLQWMMVFGIVLIMISMIQFFVKLVRK